VIFNNYGLYLIFKNIIYFIFKELQIKINLIKLKNHLLLFADFSIRMREKSKGKNLVIILGSAKGKSSLILFSSPKIYSSSSNS